MVTHYRAGRKEPSREVTAKIEALKAGVNDTGVMSTARETDRDLPEKLTGRRSWTGHKPAQNRYEKPNSVSDDPLLGQHIYIDNHNNMAPERIRNNHDAIAPKRTLDDALTDDPQGPRGRGEGSSGSADMPNLAHCWLAKLGGMPSTELNASHVPKGEGK